MTAQETGTGAAPLLELRGVHTYYGQIHALKGLDMTVKEGEIVALIGGNGAGKTTTLRTVSGMMKPKQGQVIYAGQDVTGVPAHTLAVSFAFPDYHGKDDDWTKLDYDNMARIKDRKSVV